MASAPLPLYPVRCLRGLFFWIWGINFWPIRKHKKIFFSKTLQHLKNSTRCCQSYRFRYLGGPLLASIFAIFHNSQLYAKCLFWLIKASHFDIKNPSKNHFCFKTPSCTPFFQFLCRSSGKVVDLGTPSKSSGRQTGTQNRPSGANLSTNPCFFNWWSILFATCFS